MKVLFGFLAGFALGVAAGLILAPQSGEATRAQLGEQGIMLRDRSSGLSGRNSCSGYECTVTGSRYVRTHQGRVD